MERGMKDRNEGRENADIGLLLCMAPEITPDPFPQESIPLLN
jgi:hypothetical protein